MQVKGPRLEIKKDVKGMVHVPGATLVTVHSAKELLNTIEKGQLRRHVGETQATSPHHKTSICPSKLCLPLSAVQPLAVVWS